MTKETKREEIIRTWFQSFIAFVVIVFIMLAFVSFLFPTMDIFSIGIALSIVFGTITLIPTFKKLRRLVSEGKTKT